MNRRKKAGQVPFVERLSGRNTEAELAQGLVYLATYIEELARSAGRSLGRKDLEQALEATLHAIDPDAEDRFHVVEDPEGRHLIVDGASGSAVGWSWSKIAAERIALDKNQRRFEGVGHTVRAARETL